MYIDNLYDVMTKQTKGKLVNFRVRDDLKREFEIVAELRGTTLSGLIHQLLVKAVREEKEREPQAFVKSDAGIQPVESNIRIEDRQKFVLMELEELGGEKEHNKKKKAG